MSYVINGIIIASSFQLLRAPKAGILKHSLLSALRSIGRGWHFPSIGQSTSEVKFSQLEEEFYMKHSKFTDSQIRDALKRVDASLAVPEVYRKLGISTATFYK